MFVGLFTDELAVDAPVNVQLVTVNGPPVDVFVKLIQSPSQMLVEEAVKEALGGDVQVFTVMKFVCVSVSLPFALVTLKDTVYVPAVG